MFSITPCGAADIVAGELEMGGHAYMEDEDEEAGRKITCKLSDKTTARFQARRDRRSSAREPRGIGAVRRSSVRKALVGQHTKER